MWLLENISLHMRHAFAACTEFLMAGTDLRDGRNPNSSLEAKGTLFYLDKMLNSGLSPK